MVSLVFVVDILQLPHTVISNSEKLTHPNVYATCSLLKSILSKSKEEYCICNKKILFF